MTLSSGITPGFLASAFALFLIFFIFFFNCFANAFSNPFHDESGVCSDFERALYPIRFFRSPRYALSC